MNAGETQALVDRVQKAVQELGEHFDSVRVFCTIQREGKTSAFDRGCGNFYAQLGQAQEFLTRDRVQTEIAEKKDDEQS